MKKLVGIVVVVSAVVGIGIGIAKASDKYHVYKQSNGSCEVDQRSHSQYDSARGSGWSCLAEYDYNSDALNELERRKSSGDCH